MKIGTIVTASDTNPLYMDFIPIFVRAWKHLLPEADIRIVLIAESLPESLQSYASHIHLVSPIPGVHTAFHAQCVRLLYPREVTRDEGVLITDMDMLPMNRRYYVDTIRDFPEDAFVVYRDVCLPSEISMCYNVAHPATWTSVFGSEPTNELLQKWNSTVHYDGAHGGSGWNTDQVILVNSFNAWGGRKIVLNDEVTRFARLDRAMPFETWGNQQSQIHSLIRDGYFADYHCLRPYSTYKAWNDWVVARLEEVCHTTQ